MTSRVTDCDPGIGISFPDCAPAPPGAHDESATSIEVNSLLDILDRLGFIQLVDGPRDPHSYYAANTPCINLGSKLWTLPSGRLTTPRATRCRL